MKSYTDIEQSRKLAEILPLESADMRYGHIAPYEFSDRMYDGGYDKAPYPKDFLKLCADFCEENIYDGSLPCWSLAALLDVIPNYKLSSEHNYHTCTAETSFGKETIGWFDNSVDACYEMILKLHEQNLL